MEKEHQKESDRFFRFLNVPFCIYGAGIVAASVYTVLRDLYRKKPLFFLVSDAGEGKTDENPMEIDGIPVKRLSEWKREISEVFSDTVCPAGYLVVAPETHHCAITESLHSLQIENSAILPVTGELENQLMEAYYNNLPGCKTVKALLAINAEYLHPMKEVGVMSDMVAEAVLEEAVAESSAADADNRGRRDMDSIQVFQAKCHVDRPLQNEIRIPSYVYPIQVGADLTEQRITELRDNAGANISRKNRNYCELTATYYAWKNCQAAYKGLCHYRRIFAVDDREMEALLCRGDEWDVILPYPSVHYPNISTQHFRYIKEEDWSAMLRALEETVPDYFSAYQQMVESGEQHFYNYNMLIAKAEVFDDYCGFLFSVLERAEALTTPKGWERADRFAGYMGENLTTLYFQKNRDKLKIVHAGKKWMV